MKATDLAIQITIKGTGSRDLTRELEIDLSDLSSELVSQPSWYAYYATLLAEANAEYEEEKADFESFVAEVSSEHRSKGGVTRARVTEKQVELDTTMDPRIRASRKRILEKKKQVEFLKVATRAFEQRLDCMIALGHLERKQQYTEPSVKTEYAKPKYGHTPEKGKGIDVTRLATKAEYMAELEALEQKKSDLKDHNDF